MAADEPDQGARPEDDDGSTSIIIRGLSGPPAAPSGADGASENPPDVDVRIDNDSGNIDVRVDNGDVVPPISGGASHRGIDPQSGAGEENPASQQSGNLDPGTPDVDVTIRGRDDSGAESSSPPPNSAGTQQTAGEQAESGAAQDQPGDDADPDIDVRVDGQTGDVDICINQSDSAGTRNAGSQPDAAAGDPAERSEKVDNADGRSADSAAQQADSPGTAPTSTTPDGDDVNIHVDGKDGRDVDIAVDGDLQQDVDVKVDGESGDVSIRIDGGQDSPGDQQQQPEPQTPPSAAPQGTSPASPTVPAAPNPPAPSAPPSAPATPTGGAPSGGGGAPSGGGGTGPDGGGGNSGGGTGGGGTGGGGGSGSGSGGAGGGNASGETDNDASKIQQAAKNLLGSPLTSMVNINKAVKAAALPLGAFGIVGIPTIAGQYEQSRLYIEENSRQGIEKMRETSAALYVVAGRYSSVEEANTMDPTLKGVKAPANTAGNTGTGFEQLIGGSTALVGGSAAAAAIGVNLASRYAPALFSTISSATLDSSAIIGAVAWALVKPDDAAIRQAITSWGSVSTAAQLLPNDIDTQLHPLADGWTKGDARGEFDRFRRIFLTEIAQLGSAATTNSGTLNTIVTTLTSAMFVYGTMAIVALGLLVAATIAQGIPQTSAIATQFKRIVGSLLSWAAIGTVAIIATTVTNFIQSIGPLVTTVKFAGPVANEGGGTSFKEISVDWDRPQPLK